MEKKPTHKEMIIAHLLEHGSLDAWTALTEYGIFTSLHARITELREAGYDIETRKIKGVSKVTGRPYTIANYVLNRAA